MATTVKTAVKITVTISRLVVTNVTAVTIKIKIRVSSVPPALNVRKALPVHKVRKGFQAAYLTLNGQDLAYTVVGRATGTSQIVGMAIVTTTAVNSVLTVRNPEGNAAALTVTPLVGGTRPVSAHLVITQIG